MEKRTVIIGIDGVPFGLMNNLSEKGVMPHFKKLKNEGVFKKMRSSIPPISSISWISIITGKNPGEHGIFGFMELMPKTYTLHFPNFNDVQEKPFWLKKRNKKFAIINVPSTYPPKPLNGIHLSGFISLDLEKAVYPPELFPKLKEMNYQVDVDSSLAHQSMSLFLKKLNETLEARIEAYRYLWKKEDWDVFMFVFTGTDRIGHFLWDAYRNKNHQYHADFLDHFNRIDKVIGEISKKLRKDDSLFMLSDHGMGKMKANVNINYFLKKRGFLDLDKNLKSYNQITEKTKAFALEPARIYIHRQGKYPRGKVNKSQREKITKQLVEAFNSLKYENRKVIKKIYHKEEIYQGKCLNQAPDLVLLPRSGFRFRANIDKETLFEKDVFSGEHTLDDSFLFVRSPQIRDLPENLTVEDFVPLLEKTF
ncbi:MAG TPA: alkaline phosphatase family protein [Patescibacteria group bacterium]|nr:alkaline phosphatase family protein [Patescibacteria group bacterium]